MSTSFPAALDNFTNPSPTSPRSDHAAQHANANDAIEAIQALLGITGSSDPASITKRVAVLMAEQATQAKTLWVNGVLFWIPAGDGGANGMNFAGDGSGTFTLSAVFTGLTTGAFGFVLLPSNSGGSGNISGWYYFVFTGATSGKIYTHTYDSTSGLYPTIPTSPTELSFVSSARITTTIAEIQICQIPINYVTQMGINGMLEAIIFGIGATEYLRAGSNLLYSNDQVGSGVQSTHVNINAAGSLSKQTTMRNHSTFGANLSTLNGNYKTVNLAAETTLKVGLKLASTTANGIICLHKLTAIYGG